MSLLRYYGGKWRLAKWIISQFPAEEYYDTFVDGFGGAASITLKKTPSLVEVYNDLDLAVHTFMCALRDNRDELIDKIMMTPYHRFELEQCRLPRNREAIQKIIDEAGNIEVARRFYVLSWQGRGMRSATYRDNSGWRFSRQANVSYPPDDFYNVDDVYIAADRLKRVQMECDDIKNIIKNYDTHRTLFYLDPPYAHSSKERNELRGYANEFTDEDHRNLRKSLDNRKGMFIVSGYRSDLYDEIYHGWRKSEVSAQDDKINVKTECLWFSPNIKPIQLALWEELTIQE